MEEDGRPNYAYRLGAGPGTVRSPSTRRVENNSSHRGARAVLLATLSDVALSAISRVRSLVRLHSSLLGMKGNSRRRERNSHGRLARPFSHVNNHYSPSNNLSPSLCVTAPSFTGFQVFLPSRPLILATVVEGGGE